MARYIDIEPLENEGWYLARVYNDSLTSQTYETKKLKDFPIADVVEREKGEWIEDDDATVRGHCSVCGWESHYCEDDVVGMPFCPNCGADMRGEKDG